MSSIEQQRVFQEGTEDLGEVGLDQLDRVLASHSTHSTALMKKGLDARGVLDGVATENPEKAEDIAVLRQRLSDIIRDAQETLEKLAATTALSSTLAELAPGESKEGRSPIDAETIAKNPELAEKLLEGVVEVGERADENDYLDHSLASDAKEVLKEVKAKRGKKYKIAAAVAERIFKIVLDANTFGLGGAVYDTIKDILAAFKERQAKAA